MRTRTCLLLVRAGNRSVRLVSHQTCYRFYSRPLSRYQHRRRTMSSAILKDNPILNAIDSLIDKVKHLTTNNADTQAQAATTTTSDKTATTNTSNTTTSSTTDVAWRPVVPPGHTSYTWGLEGDTNDDTSTQQSKSASSSTTAPAPAPAARTSESSVVSSSSVSTDSAARGTKPAKAKIKSDGGNKAKGASAAPPSASGERCGPEISRIDIRVGQVEKPSDVTTITTFTDASACIITASAAVDTNGVCVFVLCSADTLYVEEIDVGESSPRQVVSGLVKFVPLEEMSKARLCVVVNLKPSALRGVMSYGMVLAASNADHSKVELIAPPPNAKVGERITLLDTDCSTWTADAVVDPKAKKDNAWTTIQTALKTDDSGVATWSGHPLGVNGQSCRSATLFNATIS